MKRFMTSPDGRRMIGHETTVGVWRVDAAQASGPSSQPAPASGAGSEDASTSPHAPANRGQDATAACRQPQSVPQLSDEELALLQLVAEGLPIDSVAARLSMSPRTVRRRMHDLCDRIGVTGTMQAVVWAAHHGLV
jgi:DNA-binding NarL/FixJ family response regulator